MVTEPTCCTDLPVTRKRARPSHADAHARHTQVHTPGFGSWLSERPGQGGEEWKRKKESQVQCHPPVLDLLSARSQVGSHGRWDLERGHCSCQSQRILGTGCGPTEEAPTSGSESVAPPGVWDP